MAITLDGTTGAIGGTSLTATGAISAGSVDATTVTEGAVEMPKMVLSTAQATTSGTSIDFTGIPSWVKRITVMFNGVSTNGTSLKQVQLGYSGGIETTGYLSSASYITVAVGSSTSTTGLLVGAGVSAADQLAGHLILTLVSGNVWIASTYGAFSNTAGTYIGGGSKTLSGTLDRIRLTTVNGTDTFDAGSINILVEG